MELFVEVRGVSLQVRFVAGVLSGDEDAVGRIRRQAEVEHVDLRVAGPTTLLHLCQRCFAAPVKASMADAGRDQGGDQAGDS